MPTCKVTSCVVGKRCLLWPVYSLDKTVSLCPASFCTPRSNLPVTPGVSWPPTFSFQFPVMKKTSFFVVVILGNLLGLYTNVQLQLPWHQWLWHRLGLLWSWMVCLEDEVKSSCHFSQNIKGTFWPFKKNHMKRCQYCWILEMQIETTATYRLTPFRVAILRISTNLCEGVEKRECSSPNPGNMNW